MRKIIIDNKTKNLSKLVSLIEPDSVVEFYDLSNLEIKPSDFLVLSGGSGHSVMRDHGDYTLEAELILKHRGPIFGICLGFELIAKTFGCSLVELDNKQSGVMTVNIEGQDYSVFESHRFAVQEPGEEIISLGRSRTGIEVIRHRQRQIIGFQFHPEVFVDENDGALLYERYINDLIQAAS